MSGPWAEFGTVAAAHLLAVASPGPDFAIVLRQSLSRGRRAAVWTSVGIGTAISLHVTYAVLGAGLFLRGSPAALASVKVVGSLYLGWVGIQALRSRGGSHDGAGDARLAPPQSARAAWSAGFLTNALNPKVTLFFAALLVAVISPSTPKPILVLYGLWIVVMTTAWFCGVSLLFTLEGVRTAFLRKAVWIDRALGLVFLGFSLSLLAAAIR